MPRFSTSFLQRLDPRRSLSAAVGWLVMGLSLSLTIAASAWVGKIVSATLIQQHSLRLASTADYIASELNLALSLRLQSVSISASMLSHDIRSNQTHSLQRVLSGVQKNFPDFVWIAAADADGQVLAATDPKVIGSNVYQYAWFSQGMIVSWIEEGISFNHPEYLKKGEGRRFLKLTAPIRGEHGGVLGVVAARLSWDWVMQLVRDIDRGMSHVAREEWLLLDRDNRVRIGPEELIGKHWQDDLPPVTASVTSSVTDFGPDSADLPARLAIRQLNEGRSYLVAEAKQDDNDSLQQLGWRVVVIQPVSQVTEIAMRVLWQIAAVLLGLGLAAALLGLSLAQRLTRRIRMIARSADAVLSGSAQQIAVPGGADEAARLGTALDRLLSALQSERDDLRSLNAELDQRVAERTNEIQRLAEEARYSAVVRERLKIARDLHDTLAHSMMAMLTEIRLLKKIATTNPDALADELIEAEKAAHQGLREARAAITQMRYNPARDVGLGAALKDHARLFGERTGIQTQVECDPSVATFSEERAETLFRIAEESLRNVERHAGAKHVKISLQQVDAGTAIALSIQDDGVGFELQEIYPGHYGLLGLREQAQMIGAELSIQSLVQQGTTVTITLPVTVIN